MNTQEFTPKTAKDYLNFYFDFYSELYAATEATESGVINKTHVDSLTNSELLEYAEAARCEVRYQVGL